VFIKEEEAEGDKEDLIFQVLLLLVLNHLAVLIAIEYQNDNFKF
jgi:hypothetical protein